MTYGWNETMSLREMSEALKEVCDGEMAQSDTAYRRAGGRIQLHLCGAESCGDAAGG